MSARVIYTPKFITGTTTTNVKLANNGVLHSIVVGQSPTGSIEVFDGATKIAELKSGIVEGTYIFDANYGTSLIVVTNGDAKLTVNFD